MRGGAALVVPAFVVVFYLGMKHCLVDGAVVVVRAEGGQPKCGNWPNAEGRVTVPFWEGRETGFPVLWKNAKSRSSDPAEESRAAVLSVECVSNVIYQKVYVLRLFYIPDI